MEGQDVKFFSGDLLKISAIGAAWYILIFKGFSEFFVQFGFSPVETISEMIGGLLVPLVPTYFIARYVHKNKEKNFLNSWILGVITVCVIMTIGMLNGKNHWW